LISHDASVLILMMMSTLHSLVFYVDTTSSRFSRSTSHSPHATIHKPQFALAQASWTVGQVGAAWFLTRGFRFLSCVCVNLYNFRVGRRGLYSWSGGCCLVSYLGFSVFILCLC